MRNDSGRQGLGACAPPLFWIALAMLLFPSNAHAYLDPGTGSLIIQVVIAFFLAAGMTTKIWWRRTKRFVLRIFGQEKSPGDDAG